MADEITTAMLTSAQGPKRVKDQQIEVEQHYLSDLIAADKYLKNNTAVDKKCRGLRFSKMLPPSSV